MSQAFASLAEALSRRPDRDVIGMHCDRCVERWLLAYIYWDTEGGHVLEAVRSHDRVNVVWRIGSQLVDLSGEGGDGSRLYLREIRRDEHDGVLVCWQCKYAQRIEWEVIDVAAQAWTPSGELGGHGPAVVFGGGVQRG